jgi:hypothetical protein
VNWSVFTPASCGEECLGEMKYAAAYTVVGVKERLSAAYFRWYSHELQYANLIVWCGLCSHAHPDAGTLHIDHSRGFNSSTNNSHQRVSSFVRNEKAFSAHALDT